MDIDKTVGDNGTSGGAVAGTLSSSRSIKMRRKFGPIFYLGMLSLVNLNLISSLLINIYT